MKKSILSTFMVFLFVLLVYPDFIDYTEYFPKTDLSVETRDGFDLIKLKGCSYTETHGYPLLPVKNISLLIPSGAVADSVNVLESDIVELEGAFNVYPSQERQPIIYPVKEWVLTGQSYEAYSSASEYPAETAVLHDTGNKSGYSIVSVRINPVKYIASEKRLSLNQSVKIRVFFHNQFPRSITENQRGFFEKDVLTAIENKTDIKNFSPNIKSAEKRAKSLPLGSYDLVIITSSALKPYFEDFAYYKTKRGIATEIFEVESIYSQYTGRDNPEKIRNFITDAYANWGISFVLLGGQADYENGQEIVPRRDAFYITSGAFYYPDEDTIPTDLYYSDLDGDWDFNGNDIFGEETDEVDMYSDVYVGRAPVLTELDCNIFISKVILYEENPPASDFIERLLLPTAILWTSYDETMCGEILAAMAPPSYQVTRMYERNSELTQAGFNTAYNDGYGFIHYVGHGNEYGVYTYYADAFQNSNDVLNSSNGDKTGIFNSIACMSGALDYVSGGNSFAEHFGIQNGGGSPSAIFNSRYGWGNPPVLGPSEILDTTFFSALFRNQGYFLGSVHSYSKDEHITDVYDGDVFRWCIYELNLWGDPSMFVYTLNPDTLAVVHNNVVHSNEDFVVTVYDNDNITPLEEAFVTLWCKNEKTVYERSVTNSSGIATIHVNPSINGDTMMVTVTKRNYLPYYNEAIVQLDNPTPPVILNIFNDIRVQTQTPSLSFVSSDLQNDDIEYMIYLDDDYFFSSPDSFLTAVYASAETVDFTFPSPLTDNSTYYLKIKGRDPSGTNEWGGFSQRKNITVTTAMVPLSCSWYQTTGFQLQSNTILGGAVINDEIEMSFIPYSVSETLNFEDFESGAMPDYWEAIDGDEDGYTWYVENTGQADLWGYEPPSAGNYYAYYSDDDAGASNTTAEEYLLTPVIPVNSGLVFDSLLVSFGYGFTWYENTEEIGVLYNLFKNNSWQGWVLDFVFTDNGKGTGKIDLASEYPFDSLQLIFMYTDGGAWGWAAAFDNILFKMTKPAVNTLSTVISKPVYFNDLNSYNGRTSWGYAKWEKSLPEDSIKLQIEYCNSSVWNLIPESDLLGNSLGFFSIGQTGIVDLTSLDESVYDSLRLKASFAREQIKASVYPSLLSWELGSSDNSTMINESDIAAIFENNKVMLKWTFSSVSSISGYEIYRTTADNKNKRICAKAVTSGGNNFTFIDTDENIFGKTEYRVTMHTISGSVQLPVATVFIKRIKEFSLSIKKNLFSENVSIEYSIPYDCTGRLSIIDKTGREVMIVKDGRLDKGFHSFTLPKERMASGIFFARLESGGIIKTIKIIKL